MRRSDYKPGRDGLRAPWHDSTYGRRKRPAPGRPSIPTLYISDISKLIEGRQKCHEIPETDSDEYQFAVCHLMLGRDNANADFAAWCAFAAPFMTDTAVHKLFARCAKKPRRFTADGLAKVLRVTRAERDAYGLKAIGAIDFDKDARLALRKQKKRERERDRNRRKRRDRGMKPRVEYLAENRISREKPWKAEGISRTTWYRRRPKPDGTTVLPTNLLLKNLKGNGPVPRPPVH